MIRAAEFADTGFYFLLHMKTISKQSGEFCRQTFVVVHWPSQIGLDFLGSASPSASIPDSRKINSTVEILTICLNLIVPIGFPRGFSRDIPG